MKSLGEYPVLLLSLSNNFFQFWFLASKSCILMSSKTNQLFLITNRIVNLPESPFSFSTIQFFRFTYLFWFSFQHENHHRSLHNHIFIVFPVLLHHHTTIVFPRPPPFYCFPSSSTTTTATTRFLVFFRLHLPISIAFLLFSLLHHQYHHHHIPMRISTTTTTFQCTF